MKIHSVNESAPICQENKCLHLNTVIEAVGATASPLKLLQTIAYFSILNKCK